MKIEQDNYAGLKTIAVQAVFKSALGQLQTPDEIFEMLDTDFVSPVRRADNTKTVVRDVLRQTGYKPTGRGKPASEYLIKAVSQKRLGKINPCVDVLNIVSLHSGFPISVVDLDLISLPLTIKPAPADTRFVFNASGQEIRLDGLVCLYDVDGPCANSVKDSQRTKTHATTTRTLTVFWGVAELESQLNSAVAWHAELLRNVGATIEPVPVVIVG